MERIAFTMALTGRWRRAAPRLAMTAIITIWNHADGTEYSARVRKADRETRDRHEELGVYNGWDKCIEQLAAIAENLA